jgi:histo-blood group ABO system transferase
MSRVALVTLATGRYVEFVPQLAASATLHVEGAVLFVLSDTPPPPTTDLEVRWLPWGHTPWPYSTWLRHRAISAYAAEFDEFDVVIHLDADMRFQNPAVFPTEGLFAVMHPGYVGVATELLPYERREESAACIAAGAGSIYVAGGLQGGARDAYLDACRTMAAWTQHDVSIGVTPRWHDESIWNKYCMLFPPHTVLPVEYCTPDTDSNDRAVLVALTKNHGAYRGLPLHRRLASRLQRLAEAVAVRVRRLGRRLRARG